MSARLSGCPEWHHINRLENLWSTIFFFFVGYDKVILEIVLSYARSTTEHYLYWGQICLF